MKLILGVPILILYAVLYLLARGKAREYDLEMRQYQFKLSRAADLGFWLMENIPITFGQAYLRKMRGKLAELHGVRDVDVYLEIHIAQKYLLAITALALFDFLYLIGDADATLLIMGLVIGTLMFFWPDKDLDKQIANRKRDILIDLPGFLNTLVLLVSAGLPFSGAVQKVVSDADVSRPLYRELSLVLAEQAAGKPIGQSYEDLAHRCKVPEITRLVSTIIQNLNRGGSDLVHILRLLAGEAWEKRKDIAKKQGEEASSKLVIPMVMVFLAVAIIVLAPAVITMSR